MPNSYPTSVLLDTNILLRLVTATSPLHMVTVAALARLAVDSVSVYVCPQNMQEFRQVATRPVSTNGFGWTSSQTATAMRRIESDFILLPETPAIYLAWRKIVEAVGAIGRANFDARIVASAEVNHIASVLTHEATAFARYGVVASITILDPKAI